MLTTQSYLVAMCIYLAAAFAGLLLIRRSWFPETLTRTAGLALGLVAGLYLPRPFLDLRCRLWRLPSSS